MKCPFCGHLETQVKDSRPAEDNATIRRRRFCPECGARFTTYERIQLRDLMVMKSNGDVQPFDRLKIEKSLRIALRKRPFDEERIQKITNGIVRQLESLGDAEIPTQKIGEIIMETLAPLDQVGYVRFASVYRDFREAKDFETFIGQLDKKAAS